MSGLVADRPRRPWRRYVTGYLFAAPWIVGVLGLLAGPLVLSLVLSFCSWEGAGGLGAMQWVGTENYRRALWEYHEPQARYVVEREGQVRLRPRENPAAPAVLAPAGAEILWGGDTGPDGAYAVRATGFPDATFLVAPADLDRAAKRVSYSPPEHGDAFAWKAMRNSAVYAVFSVPLGLAAALGLALLLNRQLPGIGLFRTVFYLPHVVAGVATVMMWSWVFNPQLGLLNTGLERLGVDTQTSPVFQWLYSPQGAKPALILMSLWGVGGAMLIFLAALQNVPEHLYEAAHVDGAGRWRRFWHITAPQISPAIFFNLVMGIIGALQVFTQAFLLYSPQQDNALLMMVVNIYHEAFTFNRFGYASALAWLLFLVILALTLLVIGTSRWWVYYESDR